MGASTHHCRGHAASLALCRCCLPRAILTLAAETTLTWAGPPPSGALLPRRGQTSGLLAAPAAAESPSRSKGSADDGDSGGTPGGNGGCDGGIGGGGGLSAEDVVRAKDKNRMAQKKFRQRQKVRLSVMC